MHAGSVRSRPSADGERPNSNSNSAAKADLRLRPQGLIRGVLLARPLPPSGPHPFHLSDLSADAGHCPGVLLRHVRFAA